MTKSFKSLCLATILTLLIAPLAELASSSPAFASAGLLSYVRTVGTSTTNILTPGALTIVSDGSAYVISSGGRIVKFDSSGTYVSRFGSSGSGNGQFNSPG